MPSAVLDDAVKFSHVASHQHWLGCNAPPFRNRRSRGPWGWNIPPFLLWETLSGFERFQSALKLTDQAAFTAEGFLRWLNATQPADYPPIVEVPITAAKSAEGHEEFFQSRIEWWSGGKKSS
jgi:hypothetical protein